MDKYDTLEYTRVKAIMVSVRLRNSLCALINTNSSVKFPRRVFHVAWPGSIPKALETLEMHLPQWSSIRHVIHM
jgi:hypothetical protein